MIQMEARVVLGCGRGEGGRMVLRLVEVKTSKREVHFTSNVRSRDEGSEKRLAIRIESSADTLRLIAKVSTPGFSSPYKISPIIAINPLHRDRFSHLPLQ